MSEEPDEILKTIPYWPYCTTCEQPYDFDKDEPFAHRRCGCSEWGYPRPAPYVADPRKFITEAGTTHET